jgi:transposase
MELVYRLLVGIDWATQSHQVCVLGREGRLIKQRRFEYRAEAIKAMIDWLIELAGGDPAAIAVAIERPGGALVEALIERGLHVYSINPKQLDRFRDRHTVAGAKDDRRDAFVLADSLRTDLCAFHRVRLDDPWTVQLRELTRIEEELNVEIARLANQLRELLLRFYPQLLRLCPAADQPWLWALVKLAPTPIKGQKVRRSSVERLLREHRIRKWSSDQVRAQLKTAPLPVAPGVCQAVSAHIALLLPRLELLNAQRKLCSKAVQAALDERTSEEEEKREHRDVQILLSLPGVGRVVSATMLAEASQPLAERSYHAMRCLGGVAPVTRQSGKRTTVLRRYACNHRLQNALYHWARISSQCDPRTRLHYQSLRQRGHSHGRAIRGVADPLLRILIAMLRDQTTYDHNKPRAHNPIAA